MNSPNPFEHLDAASGGNGYRVQRWYKYFCEQLDQDGNIARFKKHRITGITYVFQSNCRETDNCWNEPGYDW